MRTNFVLIDFENVQPQNIGLLAGGCFQVRIFMGANQTRVAVETARALQPLGSDAEYIQVKGHGCNALDFHIAYYIGRLAATQGDAFFHIVSKDKGFDPLIKHLATQKVLCRRSESIEKIPLVRAMHSTSTPEQADAVIARLGRMKSNLPRTARSLRTTIDTLFPRQLPADGLEQIMDELTRRGVVQLTDGKVSYHLPSCTT